MTDPFDGLFDPPEPQTPRPRFARELRERLVAELGLDRDELPTIDLPERKPMTTPTRSSTDAATATAVTPYLTASDAGAALDFYAAAFGAVEQFRVVGDDGRLGHAEFTVGATRFMLSDEYEELGVVSPATLGGTATALYLEVDDVDALFARAVAAGATAQREPADQTHGNRIGTLLDPFGHRWMLSQPLEAFDLDRYAERETGGFTVRAGPGAGDRGHPGGGGIWAVLHYTDARAGIRFLTEVLGFEEQLVVPDEADPSVVVHSELRWPEGGVVQVGTAGAHDDTDRFTRPPGQQLLYVITADPDAVWARCRAADVEIVRPLESPHYDRGGRTFSVRDPEGNIFSFGTYAG